MWANEEKRFLTDCELNGSGGFYYDYGVTPSVEYIMSQYTGLKDNNGKEIYEGDIVRWIAVDDEAIRGKIIWIDEAARFEFLIFGEDEGYGFYRKEAQERLEVIGNIYEDPDLNFFRLAQSLTAFAIRSSSTYVSLPTNRFPL